MSLKHIAPLLIAAAGAGCTARSGFTGTRADAETVSFPDAEIVGETQDGGGPRRDAGDGGPTVFDGDGGVYARPTAPELEPIATAAAGRVRFKGGTLLRADLAAALSLNLNQVASELGNIDGFTIHNIALRGVDPYGAGIFEPNEQTPVTAPAVVDRVVLSACRTRVDRDLARPENAVIVTIPVSSNGFFEDGSQIGTVVDRLYQRMLGRNPEAHERAAIAQFYGNFVANHEERGARGWAILSCFMVGTSLEMLFY